MADRDDHDVPDAPNLIPGPMDRGGEGGMATRESQARHRGEDPTPLATDDDEIED